MQFKLNDRSRGWIIICLGFFIICLGWWYWVDSQTVVELQPHGKAILYRGGFFHHEKFDLIIWRGKWRFDYGTELLVPFECSYNQYRKLRFEDHGKVYMVDKSKLSREELKVVNGEWSYDAGDHWQSVFDLDY